MGSEDPAAAVLKPRVLLRQFGLRPDRRLGQNFLADHAARERIIKVADLGGEETVLEIGAGLGALTWRLAQECTHVIAVEFDRRLIPILDFTLQNRENVKILHGDILELEFEPYLGTDVYHVVANIPYNITSAVIRRLMEARKQAERVVLTVQKEVAERIVAHPGGMSLLALSVQIYGNPTISARLPSGAFYPRPKVDSAVLRIDIHPKPIIPRSLIIPLFRLARAGFGQKRKQLRNALANGLQLPTDTVYRWLQVAEIPTSQRAQELSLLDWARLAQAMVDVEGL
ncbi:MAG: ribosomal RNA small subunit methyltransferase A [Anaerolineales bacterium]|nr:ribosomal RNA small subunit methyltransferase A [Anaerolineales bacterium]